MFYLLAAGARACVYDDDAASCARAMAFWGSRNRAPRAKCAVGGRDRDDFGNAERNVTFDHCGLLLLHWTCASVIDMDYAKLSSQREMGPRNEADLWGFVCVEGIN